MGRDVFASGLGELVDLLAVDLGGGDQALLLEQREGRIDRAGTRTPQVLRLLLDALDQLVTVGRLLHQERQDRVADVTTTPTPRAATLAASTWATHAAGPPASPTGTHRHVAELVEGEASASASRARTEPAFRTPTLAAGEPAAVTAVAVVAGLVALRTEICVEIFVEPHWSISICAVSALSCAPWWRDSCAGSARNTSRLSAWGERLTRAAPTVTCLHCASSAWRFECTAFRVHCVSRRFVHVLVHLLPQAPTASGTYCLWHLLPLAPTARATCHRYIDNSTSTLGTRQLPGRTAFCPCPRLA